MLEKYKILQEKLSAKYFTIYDAKLSTLADSMQIKTYANNIIMNIVTKYEQDKIENMNNIYYWKLVLAIAGVVILRYYSIF